MQPFTYLLIYLTSTQREIKCKFNIEIVEQDERYTSIEASQIMNEIGIKKKKKRKVIDQIAAVLILEGYLKNLKKYK